MLKLLFLATAIVAVYTADAPASEPVNPDAELKPAESASPVMVGDDDRHRNFQDGRQLNRYREQRMRTHRHKELHDDHDYDLEDHKGKHEDDDHHHSHGPVILRTINPHSHRNPDIEKQNKIIADVYSPDYYQPTWILDYRYLKTGGRDYTRGPGGQILILPKNVRSKERNQFPDFDSLLEHLRLSRLAEKSRHRHRPVHNDAFQGYTSVDHSHKPGYGYRQMGYAVHEHSRGHEQNWWNPYSH